MYNRAINTFTDPYPVQSNDGDAPINKAEQVVGSILSRNSSTKDLLSKSSVGSPPESGIHPILKLSCPLIKCLACKNASVEPSQ